MNEINIQSPRNNNRPREMESKQFIHISVNLIYSIFYE